MTLLKVFLDVIKFFFFLLPNIIEKKNTSLGSIFQETLRPLIDMMLSDSLEEDDINKIQMEHFLFFYV